MFIDWVLVHDVLGVGVERAVDAHEVAGAKQLLKVVCLFIVLICIYVYV